MRAVRSDIAGQGTTVYSYTRDNKTLHQSIMGTYKTVSETLVGSSDTGLHLFKGWMILSSAKITIQCTQYQTLLVIQSIASITLCTIQDSTFQQLGPEKLSKSSVWSVKILECALK